ncbi:preprotein translocase subunit YajC [Acetobacter sacchari]|uniref:preprotein translocase subunit YajC n=1 Tax=Acetobacter sacchari TaxID=2661687 RepID=UPI001FB04627|nr:preprotein translocase subunit YajC [Acetobacter sacchari]
MSFPHRFALALGAAVLGATVISPASAQGVITSNMTAVDTVETIDPDTGTVLLTTANGDHVTVSVPADARKKLPHIEPGDQLRLHFFQTVDAEIALPDAPLPESTVSASKGYARRHPHGTMVSFRRQRVHVLAVDAPHHTVTFSDGDLASRTVTVRQKAMRDFLATLKPGDTVDLTTMDSVGFEVLNRTVTPDVKVQENAGQH